jgi:hypothetical protein
VAPCAVCTVHVKTRSAGFLVEPQNQGQRFVSGLASKPLGRFLIGLGIKTDGDGFLQFGLKTGGDGFSSLASKLVATVSPDLSSKSMVGFLIEPQNQIGGGFSGLGLKTGSSGLVIWVSKSPRQFLDLGLKTKRALIYQLHHKTDGGRSVWDTRRDLAACFTWKQV